MFIRHHYVTTQAIIVISAVMAVGLAPAPRRTHANPPANLKAGAVVRGAERPDGQSVLNEISFVPRSFSLDATARNRLARTLGELSRRGASVARVRLVVWADAEYPATRQNALPGAQVRLADRRAKAINDYLIAHVPRAISEAYNMAERPGPLDALLSTADARVKSALERDGIRTTRNESDAPGYAGKALVLIEAAPALNQ